MTNFLRYAGIAIVVLVLAIVLTVCGEGAGLSCAHPCCEHPDRVDRLRTGLDRLLVAYAVFRYRADEMSGSSERRPRPFPGTLAFASPLAGVGSPLRT